MKKRLEESFYLFAHGVKNLSQLVVVIMFKIDSSLSFPSDLERGVHLRARVEQRSRER